MPEPLPRVAVYRKSSRKHYRIPSSGDIPGAFYARSAGDVPFKDMVEDHGQEQGHDHLRGDIGKLRQHISHGNPEAVIQDT